MVEWPWNVAKMRREGCNPSRGASGISKEMHRSAGRTRGVEQQVIANDRSAALPASSPREAPAQPHDVADHLGHRLVVVGRDLSVDLDGGMQRARQRRILDHRHAVLPGDLADAQRDVVDALGDAYRRVHAALATA